MYGFGSTSFVITSFLSTPMKTPFKGWMHTQAFPALHGLSTIKSTELNTKTGVSINAHTYIKIKHILI